MSVVVLAESGSTKTEWRVCSHGIMLKSFRTVGLNPTTYDPGSFQAHVKDIFQQYLLDQPISTLFFYGAGLRDPSQRDFMYQTLQSMSPDTDIYVEDDLLAAVHATSRPAGIICILGTGSNASRYESGNIVERRGGHGYLLGDEGSGVDLGKSLLKTLLQRDFPESLQQEWICILGKEPEVLRGEIYHAARPQIALGDLTLFIPRMLHHPEVENLVFERFTLFLSTTVCRFQDANRYPIDFVGSVAFYFRDVLNKSLANQGLRLGKLINHPIEELLKKFID